MQVTIICFFNVEVSQVSHGGTFEHQARWVEAGSMTWTFKPEVACFERTTQMSAFKTDGSNSALVMDDDGGDVGQDCAAVNRVILGGTDIVFSLGGFVVFVAQKSKESTNPKYTRQGEEGIG